MTTPRRPTEPTYAPPASYASYAVRPAERPARVLPDRKESEVRRMLDVPHPPVPPDLAERAMVRGRRILHRRRVRHTILWLLLIAAVAAAVVTAVVYGDSGRPLLVTPPLTG